jgi:AcrR family transcriptional regulator
MRVKAGKNDESREKTRAALLQAGADLLVEHASRNPFAALRLRSLCERAGYSTGAFYLHWASVEQYYDELATLLSEPGDRFNTVFDNLAREAKASINADALDAVVRVAKQDFSLLVEDQLWDAAELMLVTWGRTRFREPVARGYEVADHGTGQVYASVLGQRGREPRPPLDWDHIGVILQGLVEGLGLRHKIDPTTIQPTDDATPGLYATAVAAILAVLTRPAGDTQDVHEALGALLAEASAPNRPATGNPAQ